MNDRVYGIADPITVWPTSSEYFTLRSPQASDQEALQAIWVASQDADDPAFRPRDGWWSLADWAVMSRLLFEDGVPIGVVALNFVAAGDATEVRLALVPAHRTPQAAQILIEAARTLTEATGLATVRLVLPSAATWAIMPAVQEGFRRIRATHVMLRPADADVFMAPAVAGVRIRRMHAGEEQAVLAALNRAWAGTWNFHPLALEVLMADLEGQGAGFLVAVDTSDDAHIVGTVHAIFDPTHQNSDGQPYAWISNLTTDPAWRGRGLGRALLAAGLDYLRQRGARSVALGVDGGNPVPLKLYATAGFRTISTLEIWEGMVAHSGVTHD